MSEVLLAQIKKQVFAEDFTFDDVILQGFIDAAEQHIEAYLRRDMAVDFPGGWPSAVKQAALMLASHFYLNRSATTPSGKAADVLPYGVKAMLSTYRNLA